MSLVGTYKSNILGATLVVNSANVSNGRGEGTFTIGGKTMPVSLHYHFKDSTGRQTALNFVGNQDDPNRYVGGAGNTLGPEYKTIEFAGGFSNNSRAISFGGVLERQ